MMLLAFVPARLEEFGKSSKRGTWEVGLGTWDLGS
jgi:hypothetical protein